MKKRKTERKEHEEGNKQRVEENGTLEKRGEECKCQAVEKIDYPFFYFSDF